MAVQGLCLFIIIASFLKWIFSVSPLVFLIDLEIIIHFKANKKQKTKLVINESRVIKINCFHRCIATATIGRPARWFSPQSCWVSQKKRKQVKLRETFAPLTDDLFSFWQLKGPSGGIQREYQKGTKKEPTVCFHNVDGPRIRWKSHGDGVTRTKRSARTWKLLRLTPPTNDFQQLTSPLHHRYSFSQKPWNCKKKKKGLWGVGGGGGDNKCMSRAGVRFGARACVQQLKATKRNNFSRGSPEIYHFRRAGRSVRHKVQSNGAAFFFFFQGEEEEEIMNI